MHLLQCELLFRRDLWCSKRGTTFVLVRRLLPCSHFFVVKCSLVSFFEWLIRQYYVAADRPVAHESLKKAMSQ